MTSPDSVSVAKQYNQSCHCQRFDKSALHSLLQGQPELYAMLVEQRPDLFSDTMVFIDQVTLQKQYQLIAAIEKIIALPSYQQYVLAYAPDTAHFVPKAHGVFLGYDFHLTPTGSQLIEINTNAGGALLNALMLKAKGNASQAQHIESAIMAMFLAEWRDERGLQPLTSIAIVDTEPSQQFLLPEFLLFQQLFQRYQINAVICDPRELNHHNHAVWYRDSRIDLVYNRLTDFGLQESAHQSLRAAYLNNAVVVTPHPRVHALYADKRNLALLTDSKQLQALGIDDATIDILLNGIAPTIQVVTEHADDLWKNRKQLFFKPSKGYGSKAVYRGDKLTKRVFDEILANEYVAQAFVAPEERLYQNKAFKFDIRHYAYHNQILLTSARLYQGQTTNFRTEGGGFAEVVVA